MKEYILKIDGMHCSMCETHVNEAGRKVEGVKKIKSSNIKGESDVTIEDSANIDSVKEAIEEEGYKVLSVTEVPYKKKSFFSFLKK